MKQKLSQSDPDSSMSSSMDIPEEFVQENMIELDDNNSEVEHFEANDDVDPNDTALSIKHRHNQSVVITHRISTRSLERIRAGCTVYTH